MLMQVPGTKTTEKVRCVWVLAASPAAVPIPPHLPRPDFVIAADGGSALAARLGIVPDLLIGDLDSSDPSLVAELEQANVRIERYRHDTKWETDTELAVLAAADMEPEAIILLGATGGRLDHSLANVLLLTHPRLSHVNLRIVDGTQSITLAKPGAWNAVAAETGDTVSLLPVGVEATGVQTEGLEYPLAGETLLPGRGRGVSNIAKVAGPSVYLDSGILLIVTVQKVQQKENKDGDSTN